MRIQTNGGDGQGILLIDGDLELDFSNGDFNFYGLIIQKGPGDGVELGEDANIYGAIRLPTCVADYSSRFEWLVWRRR